MNGVVMVGGVSIDLCHVEPLATGGEATVYAVGAQALKIWHAPTSERGRKLRSLIARQVTLPSAVVAPSGLVSDPRDGEVVGFAMPLLPPSFEPIALLARSAHRAARGITNRDVVDVFRSLARTIATLHRGGVVVGDLSDQNVAIDPGSPEPVRLIDVDSFQMNGFPCEVATEAFLDPMLYGPDVARPCLTASGAARIFTPESDHYAFAVLLFRTLLGAHPYGGALDDLPTLPRRALARASLRRGDVRTPPRVREAMGMLDAPLVATFEAFFERGARTAIPQGLLAAYADSLVTCGCGLEVPASRLPCPRCAAQRVALAHHAPAGLGAVIVLEAQGPIVAVVESADAIFAVAIERGLPWLYVVRGTRMERFELAHDAARSGWDVALASGTVAVAPRGGEGLAPLHVRAVSRSGLSSADVTTERCRGTASVAVAHDVVFRVARGMVLAGVMGPSGLEERALATVMTSSVRLFGAELGATPAAIVVGWALGRPRWELVTRRGSTTLSAPDLAPGETVDEIAAYGDAEGVTVLQRTRMAGRALVRVARFDEGGRRTAERVTPEDGRAAQDVITGGASRGGAVLFATTQGLVREDARGLERRFDEAAPFTSSGSPVALARGGVLVADGRVLRRLVLR